MMKYEDVFKSHPELKGDPAAAREFLKFGGSTDPAYMKATFEGIKRRSGGNKLAEQDELFARFNPQSAQDMQIYRDVMAGKEGSLDAFLGKGINTTRKATLGKAQMNADAQSSVGVTTEFELKLLNQIQQSSIDQKEFFKEVTNYFKTKNKNTQSNKVYSERNVAGRMM